MITRLNSAIAIVLTLLLITAVAIPAVAAEDSIENGTTGFDYNVDGIVG